MPDLRNRKRREVNFPEFSSYQVQRDKRGGFNIKLNWEYQNDKVVGFRIYKANYSLSLARKNFLISQRALEKLTPATSPRFNSTILFDKNYFVENSKVKFDQEAPSRHRVDEFIPTNLDYSLLNFSRIRPDGKYSFVDKSVKFGATCSYVITAVQRNLRETDKGSGLFVTVEDLDPPVCVHNFELQETLGGVLVTTTLPDCSDVEKYQVWRRRVPDKDFVKIFEGQNTQKNIALVDEDVVPGNEYEYKVYVSDFYNNLSWSSEVKRIEFKSIILSKGAVIDPLVRIFFDDPDVVIEGRKNNPRIIGYRIERQDLWRFEKDFEIKNQKEVPWPNTILFDDRNVMELRDTTAVPGRAYRYRVSSISLNGKIESLFITPPLDPAEAFEISSPGFTCEECLPVEIKDFRVDVENRRQDPVYAKISWDVAGDWDYLNILVNEDEQIIKVDSLHKEIFFSGLEKGKQHKIRLEIFNIDGEVSKSETVLVRI